LLTRTSLFGLVICSVGTLSGCRISGASESGGATEAFSIRLVHGVRWTSDTLRFDPRLPGYHLRGGIGTIELLKESEMSSDRLVLEISTSPGMQPNLESFTIGWGDTLLQVAPFGSTSLCEVIVKNTERQSKSVSQSDTHDFFEFQRRDSTVRVSLLPAALPLMKHVYTITWIDWYRR
jgi:hypothetical protein